MLEQGTSAGSYRRYQLVACGEPLQASRAELPAPQGTEVVLRTLAAGLCHTDLHLSDGYFDLGRGQRIRLTDRGIRLPHTLGHENVGVVQACGPEAAGVAIGDRVLAYPWVGCGSCARCADGLGHLCDQPRFVGVFRPGGFGEVVVVPHARCLFPIGDLAPAAAAPLACSGITAYSALRKAGGAIDQGPIVIIGAGGVGLMCLGLLRCLGGKGAIVVEPVAAKRAAALEMGAIAAVGTDAAGEAELADRIGAGVGAVLDFVGSPDSLGRGVAALRKAGKLVVVGMYGGELTLPIPLLVLRSISIEGSYVGSIAEMHELMSLVRRHGIPKLPLVERPMAEINDAMQDMRAGAVVGRTILIPSAS